MEDTVLAGSEVYYQERRRGALRTGVCDIDPDTLDLESVLEREKMWEMEKALGLGDATTNSSE